MATGYVKLHREAEDHPVFDDPWLWKVFCWCVMRANYKDGRHARGTFTTGRFRAAEQLRAKPSRVYEAWRRLERLGCIAVKADSQCTTITVCNYSTYQSDDDAGQQQSDNDPTTIRQQSNNDPTQIERREEGKKGRRERKHKGYARDYSPEFLQFWEIFPSYRKGSKPIAWEAWQKAILRKPASEIIAAASEYAASPTGQGEFVKGPAPWLNQDGWDDDRASWNRQANGSAPRPAPYTLPKRAERLPQ